MLDPESAEGWRERIASARSLIETHGTVDAAVQFLRAITAEPAAREPLIPILHEQGCTGREIAERLDLAQARVSRRLRRLGSLGLTEPVDRSRGGGGNRVGASPQVRAARAYRAAVLTLLHSGLADTSPEDRDVVRALIGDTRSRIEAILAQWELAE